MGIISDLFGLNRTEIPPAPIITSIVPDIAANEIRANRLPTFSTKTIILCNGEVCHFIDRASLVTEETITYGQRRHSGYSIRIMKGLTYRTGISNGTPIKKKVPIFTIGILYITNKRIIFVARENGFEKKFNSITAVVTYADALGLQFGGKTFNLILPQPGLAAGVIQLL